MVIDFSILKDINFSSLENLLFLAVFLVLSLIILIIFITIVSSVVKFSKRAFLKVHGSDKKSIIPPERHGISQPLPEKFEENQIPAPPPKLIISSVDMKIKKNEEGGKDVAKSFQEKEQKEIAENLSKLESKKSPKRETLQSKMPSRAPVDLEAQKHQKITIHTAKSGFSRKSSDQSVFGGKNEISREDLETQIKENPKIWEESRREGLYLDPEERAKIAKEVLSPSLGTNISRSDLKFSIGKLNQKLQSTKNPSEHAKIRKEIKFFKQIGGIK